MPAKGDKKFCMCQLQNDVMKSTVVIHQLLTDVCFATLCQNCCIMSLTLLDEFGNQFSCVTTPISMELEKAAVSYDYDGEHYLIQHEDSNIQVKMQLVKMTAKKHFVVSLIVYVSVLFVNKHFSRDYWSVCISVVFYICSDFTNCPFSGKLSDEVLCLTQCLATAVNKRCAWNPDMLVLLIFTVINW